MSDSSTTASFGYWVRRRRLALDMTQADLARQVGYATVTISKMERDERRPSQEMAELLAEALAIPQEERDRFVAVALGEQTVHRLLLATRPLESAPGRADIQGLTSLPVTLTPFVGREQELEQLTEKLNDPACRLLTLTGPGGFGKTRLGIRLGEIASKQVGQYPDGVHFVALDGLDNPALVVSAIAAAMHVTFYGQSDQTEQLLRYLARKRLLLILDNAEGILDRTLVARILSRAPQAKLIMTSREALNVQHEWFFPLAGMRLPDVSDDDDHGWQESDAVQLFARSALRARPDFDLSRDQRYVRRICRLVDGAPLAIELAAAWLRVLPCAQIAEELEQGLELLASTLHDVPDRHRSMRVVLEQSWQQLTHEEQRIFRQLAIFAGQFHPRAAQSIIGASFQALASLVESSMLHLTGDGYYRIHLLLRRLGQEKLASNPDELAKVQARHGDHYMRFLGARSETVAGPEQAKVLAEIQAEFDNVRSAWRYSVQQANWQALESALPCLFRILWVRGHYQEGEGMLAVALDRAGNGGLSEEQRATRVVFALRRAQLCAATGAYVDALAQLEAVKADLEQHNLPRLWALYHLVAGVVAEQVGTLDSAIEHLRAGYVIYSEIHENRGIAECAMRLGYDLLNRKGDVGEGLALVDEALLLYRSLGDLSNIADALDHAGVMRCVIAQLDEAEQCYTESLEIARKIGHQLVVARSIGGLGLIAWGHEQWETAVKLLQERLRLMQELGHDNEVQSSLNILCGIYADAGLFTEAAALLADYPDMWQTSWTAQAQMGAGLYDDAMDYLPQETASNMQLGNSYNLARNLIAWAILLLSDRALVRVTDPNGDAIPIDGEERFAQAIEILHLLRTYDWCDLATRHHATRRLASALNREGIAARPESIPSWPAHSIDDAARDMLNIRLA